MAFHSLTEVVFSEAVLVSIKPLKNIVHHQIAMNIMLQNTIKMANNSSIIS
jgi:hypothetical protein